jgi:hypothetical protein
MAVTIPIWPGSSSFFAGETPFGLYDLDPQFQIDIDKAAIWAATSLGYPVMDVELQDTHFYAAYEQAVSDYGYWVNTFAAEDNLLNLMGLASEYATAAGVGGTLTHYSASLLLRAGQQVYDLRTEPSLSLETGSFSDDNFTIRRVFHNDTPAIVKYFDPFVSTGLSSQRMLEEFSWGNYSPGVSFVLMPLFWDALRLQAIELNDKIRKSAYSFELVNDRLRIFPIPQESYRVWMTYTLESDIRSSLDDNRGLISDHSNVPYSNVVYNRINDIGKQWIRKMFLAICKEMLGRIRGKYQSLPIPGNEISLNYSELLSESEQETQELIEQLKETLDKMTKKSQLERKMEEARFMNEYLQYIPTGFKIG